MSNGNGNGGFHHHSRHSSWHGGERLESGGGAAMRLGIDMAGGDGGGGGAAGLGSSNSNNGAGGDSCSSSSSSGGGRAKSAHSRSGSLGKLLSAVSLPLPLPLSKSDIPPPPSSSPTRSLSMQSLRQYGKSSAAVNSIFSAAMKNEKLKRARQRTMLLLIALSTLVIVVLLLRPGVASVFKMRRRSEGTSRAIGGADTGTGGDYLDGDYLGEGMRLVKYRRQQESPADELPARASWSSSSSSAAAAATAATTSRRFGFSSSEHGETSMLTIHTMYYGLWQGSFELKEEDDMYSSSIAATGGAGAEARVIENVNSLPPWPEERHRVAVFTGAYSHIVDGVSLTLNKLVSFLEAQGHEVLVIAPTLPGGKSAVQNPPGKLLPTLSLSVPFRPEYRGSLPLTPSMAHALNEFSPTIVHIATPDILGLDAMRWVHFYNAKIVPSTDAKKPVPVVCSYHTRFNAYLRYYGLQIAEPVLWSYLRTFYSGCSQVYPPTPEVGNELVEHGLTSDQVRLWPRGVNITHFSPSRRSDDFRRSVIGAGAGSVPTPGATAATPSGASLAGEDVDDQVIMLFVSRLVLEKGLAVFADTVELMMKDGVDAHVVVVGEGPARTQLETRFSNTLRGDDRERATKVTFLGAMSGLKLAEAYASCDFFFFPSLTEGWGNVALEAMASGLPVVGAHATGTTFLVKANSTGFLARPDDAADMLGYVKQLTGDAELRKAMGMRARQWATSFTWDRAFSLLMRHYKEAVDAEMISF